MHIVPGDTPQLCQCKPFCKSAFLLDFASSSFPFIRESAHSTPIIGANRPTLPLQETNEVSGSRGDANFVWRCKNCKREASASIKAGPNPYQYSEPAKRQKILEFDCRGLEFVEFSPEGEWLADGAESTTKFTGVELNDGEWYDYDEKAGEEVSIKDLSWDIQRA